jgi:hypothetical protein
MRRSSVDSQLQFQVPVEFPIRESRLPFPIHVCSMYRCTTVGRPNRTSPRRESNDTSLDGRQLWEQLGDSGGRGVKGSGAWPFVRSRTTSLRVIAEPVLRLFRPRSTARVRDPRPLESWLLDPFCSKHQSPGSSAVPSRRASSSWADAIACNTTSCACNTGASAAVRS